jgi:hypothetical protein
VSDSTPRLPARPSLEQLRKQAKDRLRDLRAQDSAATLAQAQYAIAKEYGFESWPKLVHHVESLHPSRQAQFERMADDVLAGYHGNRESLLRLGANFGESYNAEQIHQRLRDKLAAARNRPGEPTLEDARFLVAALHDFASWEELRQGAYQPRHRVDQRTNTIEPRGPLAAGDWDDLFDLMRERGITGLRSTLIDDAGLKKVARQEFITSLVLDGNQRITDDGVLALAGMPQLEHLDISGWYCAVTDRGLAVLEHLPRLRRLQMTWPQRISDAGAAYLAYCGQIENVNLLGTPTGDGAINALRGRRSLTHLVTGKQVTDAGIPLLHDIPAFRSWRDGAPAGDDESPNRLSLDGPMTDRGLLGLAGLDGLFGFSLFWHCPHITGEGMQALSVLPHLEKIGLDGKIVNDAAMRHLAAMPRARELMIQGAVAGDDGWEALGRSSTVESIWGRDCPNFTGRGFRAMARMPSLRSLKLSCKRVDDASLALLPEFPALTSFMPMDVSDDGFRHVGRIERLEDLSCMYCRDTGDVATGHIAGLAHLKHYYAGKTRITDASLAILSRMDSLEQLEFWECAGLTDEGVKALARLPRLREISIEGSPRVTRAGMKVFPPRVRTS